MEHDRVTQPGSGEPESAADSGMGVLYERFGMDDGTDRELVADQFTARYAGLQGLDRAHLVMALFGSRDIVTHDGDLPDWYCRAVFGGLPVDEIRASVEEARGLYSADPWEADDARDSRTIQ